MCNRNAKLTLAKLAALVCGTVLWFSCGLSKSDSSGGPESDAGAGGGAPVANAGGAGEGHRDGGPTPNSANGGVGGAKNGGPDGGPTGRGSGDGGLWFGTRDLPAMYGTIADVQLSLNTAGTFRPLQLCLEQQIRRALGIPLENMVLPLAPEGLYHLELGPIKWSDPVFTDFARNRAVYFFQENAPTTEVDEYGNPLFQFVRDIALALESVDAAGWVKVYTPGVPDREAGYRTASMADVGILLVDETDGRQYMVYVDLAPCAVYFFEQLVDG